MLLWFYPCKTWKELQVLEMRKMDSRQTWQQESQIITDPPQHVPSGKKPRLGEKDNVGERWRMMRKGEKRDLKNAIKCQRDPCHKQGGKWKSMLCIVWWLKVNAIKIRKSIVTINRKINTFNILCHIDYNFFFLSQRICSALIEVVKNKLLIVKNYVSSVWDYKGEKN